MSLTCGALVASGLFAWDAVHGAMPVAFPCDRIELTTVS